MSQIQRYTRLPFEAPIPSTASRDLADAIRKAIADVAGKAETGVGHIITGCDGYPIVTVGDGSTCHDAARASQGGTPTLTANVGGIRVAVQANLGRSISPNSGYSGAGLTSGAIPAATDAGAADVSLSPIEATETVTIDVGGATTEGELNAVTIGATISGKTGDSKRLAVCYSGNGAGIWDDIISGSETAITGLSIDPNYISAQGGGKYALSKLYENTVSLVDAGAEASTTDLPAFTGTGNDYAFSAAAVTHDGDTMAVLVEDNVVSKHGIHIGTSVLTAPSWATLDLGTTYGFQVYGTKSLVFDENDVLYVAAHILSSYTPVVLIVEPPYSAVTATMAASWTGSNASGQWNDPSPLVLSRDWRYLAGGCHGTGGIVDVWKTDGRILHATAPASGYTLTNGSSDEQGYGGVAFGPDGRLFAIIRKTADGSYHLGVWAPPYGSTPEIIDLSMASRPLFLDWLSVSGDGQVVAVKSDSPGDILLVEPPYTSAGATVTGKSLSYNVGYQFEFDPSEAYVDATGLTLVPSITSTTGSGDSVTVVSRFTYANTSGVAAFGVVIECPIPDGSTYVSSTDDGIYDSEAGLVRWLVPSVAAEATGYVEVTTRVGA